MAELVQSGNTFTLKGSTASKVVLIPLKDNRFDVQVDGQILHLPKADPGEVKPPVFVVPNPSSITSVVVEDDPKNLTTTLPRVRFHKPDVAISTNMTIEQDSTASPRLFATPADLAQLQIEGGKINIAKDLVQNQGTQVRYTFSSPQNFGVPAQYKMRPGILVVEKGSAGFDLPNPNFIGYTTAPANKHMFHISGTPDSGEAEFNSRVNDVLVNAQKTIRGKKIEGDVQMSDADFAAQKTRLGLNPDAKALPKQPDIEIQALLTPTKEIDRSATAVRPAAPGRLNAPPAGNLGTPKADDLGAPKASRFGAPRIGGLGSRVGLGNPTMGKDQDRRVPPAEDHARQQEQQPHANADANVQRLMEQVGKMMEKAAEPARTAPAGKGAIRSRLNPKTTKAPTTTLPADLTRDTPPSTWFDSEANRIRSELEKIAIGSGMGRKIERNLKIATAMEKFGDDVTITYAGKPPLHVNLKPVGIENPANPQDHTLTISPMEMLDIMKLKRMDIISNQRGVVLGKAPLGKVQEGVADFIAQVQEKAKTSGKSLIDVYAEEKVDLANKLEIQLKGKVIPKAEVPNLPMYKNAKTVIKLTMEDQPRSDLSALQEATAAAGIPVLKLAGTDTGKTNDPASGLNKTGKAPSGKTGWDVA